MSEGLLFIQDLAVVTIVAGAAGWLCRRAGLSVVVGYLAAGMIVGPFTPPFQFVTDLDRVNILAVLGLVILMFSIGMDAGLRRLRQLGLPVLLATALTAFFVFAATRLAGTALGLDALPSIFLGGMIISSSSAIIGKVLEEAGAIHTPPGQRALGVTVMDDLVAVIVLTLLASLARSPEAAGGENLLVSLGSSIGLFLLFVILLLVLGLALIPGLMRTMESTAKGEIGTLIVFGLLCSTSFFAQKVGYSLALGAFILGVIIGDTPQKPEIARIFAGLRDLFSAVFFVAIGLQIDLARLPEIAGAIGALAIWTLVLRAAASSLSLFLIGTPPREALQAGLMLTPIGEFTFIITQLGISAAILDARYFPLAVGVATLTTLVSPFLIQNAERISSALFGALPTQLVQGLSLYGNLVERLRQGANLGILWSLCRKRLAQVALGAAAVTGLFYFAPHLLEFLVPLFEPYLRPKWVEGAFWTTLVLLAAAPVIAIWRNLDALSLLLSDALTRDTRTRIPWIRTFVVRLFHFVAASAMVLWVSTLLPFSDFRWESLLVLSLLVLASVLMLYRRLIRLQSKLEISVEAPFLGKPLPAEKPSPLAWSAHTDWNLAVAECQIPAGAQVSGQSLAQLDLRKRFGVSVVGIDRGGIFFPNPAASFVLYPGDQALLTGLHEHLDQAAAALRHCVFPSGAERLTDIALDCLVVPPDFPLVGHSLSELRLTECFRLQVLGIQRGFERRLNPGGEQTVAAGDKLLVAGTAENLRHFAYYLASAELPA